MRYLILLEKAGVITALGTEEDYNLAVSRGESFVENTTSADGRVASWVINCYHETVSVPITNSTEQTIKVIDNDEES